jgi:hypothetical protein
MLTGLLTAARVKNKFLRKRRNTKTKKRGWKAVFIAKDLKMDNGNDVIQLLMTDGKAFYSM